MAGLRPRILVARRSPCSGGLRPKTCAARKALGGRQGLGSGPASPEKALVAVGGGLRLRICVAGKGLGRAGSI